LAQISVSHTSADTVLATRIAEEGTTPFTSERGRPSCPGLAAKDVADAGVFGLDDVVWKLLTRVDQSAQRHGGLVVVMGPSGAGMGKGSLVTAVMMVRSDRFDEIQCLQVTGAAINAALVIAPISRSQLAMVIVGPAKRADLTFVPGLVVRLIDDAIRGSGEETADPLPILAFALREMYDLARKESRAAFTEADYVPVGRMDGTISRRTEAAEARHPSGGEPVLGHLLREFVALSEDRGPAARPVPHEQ
jgi:hypothetical protein